MTDIEVEDYRELLEKNRVEIVQCLDLDRQYIFSHLRSKFVLDDEDCQIILNAGPSRQQKAQKFIDVLATKGPESYHHFIDALEIEHPHLYEIFTGNKPVSQPYNPNLQRVLPWTALNDKQLLDFDREYLVKEFQKASETNQSMAYMHSKLLQEKNLLELKYEEMLKELEERDCLIQDLQYEIDNRNDQSNVNDHAEQLNEFGLHCQRLIRDSVEKSNIIITLQSRLLAMNEEHDVIKKYNDELRRKNADLMQQVRDLTINYDWQRTQSKRLSKQVDENKNIIQKNAAKKRELYELKFQLNHVTEERDDAVQRLDEFKSVMEALNARHKMLQQEKFTEEEKVEQVSGEYQRLRSEIKNLENKLHEEKIKCDTLRRHSERFQKEIEAHREQRDFYLSEREHAIKDRDQVTAERDDALRLNQDLKKSRDEAVKKQIEMSALYERQVADLIAELDQCRNEQDENRIKHVLELDDEENVPEAVKAKMTEIQQESFSRSFEAATKPTNNLKNESKTEIEVKVASAEEMRARWRDRTKTEVLQSAYGILHNKNNTRSVKDQAKSLPSSHLKYKQLALVYGSLNNPQKSPVADLLEAGGPFLYVQNGKEEGNLEYQLPSQENRDRNSETEHNPNNPKNGIQNESENAQDFLDIAQNVSTERRYSFAGLHPIDTIYQPALYKLKEQQRPHSADITTHRKLSRAVATLPGTLQEDVTAPLISHRNSVLASPFRSICDNNEEVIEKNNVIPRERANDLTKSFLRKKNPWIPERRRHTAPNICDTYQDFKKITKEWNANV